MERIVIASGGIEVLVKTYGLYKVPELRKLILFLYFWPLRGYFCGLFVKMICVFLLVIQFFDNLVIIADKKLQPQGERLIKKLQIILTNVFVQYCLFLSKNETNKW